MAQNSSVLFREIHKNAWLRRLPAADKKAGAYPKKGERVWTVFCVHNDSEPLLELYHDQKLAGAHKPDSIVPLREVLHISPTICATEDEFEFVVTIPSEVIRFTAPSWDQMIEWVDCISSKLREMRILSPKENVYSRMPEQKPLLLPTRDPNSPLPLPPIGPSSSVPGVEPVPLSESSDSTFVASGEGVETRGSETLNGVHDGVSSNVNSSLYTRALQRLYSSSSLSSQPSTPISPRRGSLRPPVPLPAPVFSVPSVSSVSSVPSTSISHNTSESNSITHLTTNTNESIFSDSNSQNCSSNEDNVTVIEVSSFGSHPTNRDVFDFSFMSESLSNNDENEEFFTPPATPVLPRSVARFIGNSSLSNISSSIGIIKRNGSFNSHNRKNHNSQNSHQTSSNPIVNSTEPTSPLEIQSINHINNIPINPPVDNPCTPCSTPIISCSSSPSISVSVAVNVDSSNQEEVEPISIDSEEGDSNVYEHIFLSANQLSPSLAPISHLTGTSDTLTTPIAMNSPIQNIHGPVSRGRGNPRSKRRGSHSELASPVAADRIRIVPSQRLQPAPRPSRHLSNPEPANSVRLTLREKQVFQLRREMMHPGGVRMQLRRKDCLGPIAFVDAFNAVWIAGWKQKEHPMLYNILHIGDQIISITGIQVHNSADVLKVIKAAQSLYVEFVIRRVPCGRVFAIRRECEGQNLGIVQENGTAEIREVIPSSLAAVQGLTSRTPTMDGLSLTPWVLTEINGRPLNLFFKEDEVKDRLNAVGLDISILVQPSDLIKQIKKQLKTLRGYKDFIVQ